MEYAQTPNSAPLTPEEMEKDLQMWKRMYERDDDLTLEMLDARAARRQAREQEQN